MKLGLLNFDYTHSWIYSVYLRDLGWEIAAIHDSGNVWTREDLKPLGSEFPGIRFLDSIDCLLRESDAILCCNARYDTNLRVLEKTAGAGKPCFIDKPICGSAADLKKIESLVASGAPVFYGSSFPLLPQAQAIRSKFRTKRDLTLHVYGAAEFFEHGIHAAEVTNSCLEVKPVAVETHFIPDSDLVMVEYEDGSRANLFLSRPGFRFAAILGSKDGWEGYTLHSGYHRESHYRRKMIQFDRFCHGLSIDWNPYHHLDGIKILLAAKKSSSLKRRILLDDLEGNVAFDGEKFAVYYAARRRVSGFDLIPPKEQLLAPVPGSLEARRAALVNFAKELPRRGAGFIVRRLTKTLLSMHRKVIGSIFPPRP